MKKMSLMFLCGIAAAGVQSAVLNEWTFNMDPAGQTLSEAQNSGSGGAVFATGGGGFVETDGAGALLCTYPGTSMWNDGVKLAADTASVTSGVHYLRCDLNYDIDSSFTNNIGSVTGLSFVDGGGNSLAGLFFSYDPAGTAVPSGAVRTPLATDLPWQGTVSAVLKVDLDAQTAEVWYKLSADAAFDELSPAASNVTVSIASIDALRFQATGLFQPEGSSGYIAVDMMRTASSWSEITAVPADAFLSVHNSFQNHMMLQRDAAAPVWGRSLPGATVTVLLDGTAVGSAKADSSGDWLVHIAPQANDGGAPHVLRVESAGATAVQFTDVIFGDVYMAAGQSNMQFAMSGVIGFAETEANASNDCIRRLRVKTVSSDTELYEPQYTANWAAVSPSTIGGFSAVAYFFAKEIQAQTGVPVGFIDSSYGGQSINRFVNPEGLAAVPQLAGVITAQEQGIITNFCDLYNAMIGPVVPYGICGFIWYQGEADCGTYGTYELKMRALMRGWRQVWGDDSLPFYYMQLPNYTYGTYPNMRQEQLRALTEPGAGMSVTIDVGDDSNIHPTNKQDPGHRLAQWALAFRHGKAVDYSGPVFAGTQVEGNQVRVLFDYAEGGLIVGQKISTNALVEVAGPLENFEIAGTNKNFVAADAVIDGDTVLVSAASVASPQHVRYFNRDTLGGTNKLYSASGLPASPFRSDADWRLLVANGTGTAEYIPAGQVVAVTANAPSSGQVFDRWIGAVVANPNSASTTLTMPEDDVYLIATYRDSAAPVYTLTVNSGSGDGAAQEGARVMIAADTPAAGMIFDRWTGDTNLLADVTAAETSLQMPSADVSVTATYTAAPAPAAVDEVEFSIGTGTGLFRFIGQAGQRYKFEYATNLLNAVWTPVFYNIKGDGLENRLEFELEPGVQVFYRLGIK